MQYVLVTHEVQEYELWKKGFDDTNSLRKDAGEIDFQVLIYEEQPNHVVHFSCWRSLREARMFFESDHVDEIRKKLGVKRPDFVYLNQMDSGIL